MKFKLALCQMVIQEEKNKNIQKAEQMLRAAAQGTAQIAVLPEMWNCPYANKFFRPFAERREDGESIKFLSKMAKELKIYIIGGSLPELEGDTVYNTSFAFDKEGNIIGRHRKMHLFDVDIKGGTAFKESDVLGAGEDITVIDTEYGKIGMMVCYDVRFPELARTLTLKGAKLIVLPAVFNMTTGSAHWEMLLKSRATDNQVYFAGAAPARDMNSIFLAFGHSAVANPWGELAGSLDANEGICYADIDFDYVDSIREQLPLLKHRRTDIY